MQVVAVGVRTDNGFVFIAQQPPCKFYARFMCLLRCDLARCIRVDNMVTWVGKSDFLKSRFATFRSRDFRLLDIENFDF